MDTLSQGDQLKFENLAVSMFSIFKVDSWQHEIELSILSNSDQISEDRNDTLIIKEDIFEINSAQSQEAVCHNLI